MGEALAVLSPSDRVRLAAALRGGHIPAPYAAAAIARVLDHGMAAPLAAELDGLGLNPAQAADVLDLLGRAAGRPSASSEAQLVATAPDSGAAVRDTAVVVADLFRNAERSVLVAGYAVHRARPIFEVLAQRMAERPGLDVRLYLDIQRGPGDTSASAGVIHRFLARLREKEWPAGVPLPPVYYDPRALADAAGERAALHAKCVVVDRAIAFVSSANLTQAAQKRNIELGLRVASAPLADSIHAFFDQLVAGGHLSRA